jgi:hypothetical protein
MKKIFWFLITLVAFSLIQWNSRRQQTSKIIEQQQQRLERFKLNEQQQAEFDKVMKAYERQREEEKKNDPELFKGENN